jgi:hypothetical protein
MTNQSSDQLFRQAAEAEGGISVSAGARVAHVRLALESGRAVTVDLSQVPEDRRSSLVAVIREMVRLSSAHPPKTDAGALASPSPKTARGGAAPG